MSSTSSKYFTVCQPLAEYSYQCQEQNPNNKSLCQEAFEAYKECREQERKEILQARRERLRNKDLGDKDN